MQRGFRSPGALFVLSLFFVVLLLTSAGCNLMPTRMTLVPTITAQPTAVPTSTFTPLPTATPTLAPTSTSTPAPTLDSTAVVSTITDAQAQAAAVNVEPLCLRWEDTNDNGTSEWIGLYHQPGDPPELQAFILDGERWYALEPLEEEEYGLGQYPTCEIDVEDINTDGKSEILIWGHAGARTDLLHIFVWEVEDYELLAFFEGEAGIRLENKDGDLSDEIVVGYNTARSNLVWEAVYTWDGDRYGWTWERYSWLYLDRPHAYFTDTPEHVVISFYLALDDRDMPAAYRLLSAEARGAQPYETWLDEFAITLAMEVGSVHEVERSADETTATITAQVRVYENLDGRVFATLWDVEWRVRRVEDTWRLHEVTTQQVDRWETPYY